MKRIVVYLLLISVLAALYGCSAKPAVYEDPFRQARDGEVFPIAGTTAQFYSTKDAEPALSAIDFSPFSYEREFSPEHSYYLIKIIELREVFFTLDYVTEEGVSRVLPYYYSILQAEIVTVFHDAMEKPLKEGDVVMVSSKAIRSQALGSVYFPELIKGESYYVVMWELVVDPEKALSHRLALDELVDYSISFFCFGLMPLRSDGMVEYYYKMMPEGKVLPYEINIGPVWAELPQEEFERGFREIIQTYSKRGS